MVAKATIRSQQLIRLHPCRAIPFKHKGAATILPIISIAPGSNDEHIPLAINSPTKSFINDEIGTGDNFLLTNHFYNIDGSGEIDDTFSVGRLNTHFMEICVFKIQSLGGGQSTRCAIDRKRSIRVVSQ